MSARRETDYAALLKRSLVAIDELEARLAAAQRAAHEPIAIVGMSCRFPGGGDSPEGFWDMLSRGVDAVTEVPKDRWDADACFDPDPDAVGKSYTRWGAFLKDVRSFDADLFGVTPREAANLDPQQRLLLEVTWDALERAGIAPASLAGSPTAVYIGMTTLDYLYCTADVNGAANGNAYTASGTAHSMAAGRLSYMFGLTGPNAAVDTACSSSLVSLHLAIQSLRSREANLALAGGANLTLHPMGSILTSRARMMSFTGRCKTFDASADGYVRGEGCAMVVLKRLADAQKDGDTILAVIRGSALNQDGRSSGLTAPNGRAQAACIRAALNDGGLKPDDVSYIEAHGTGTSLGDPIELKALGEVFASRAAQEPLYVASVKTNIGHTEAAAGIAGVIKTVLALQNRLIPPHLHLKTPNPHVLWDRLPLRVPTEAVPWISPAGVPRRAGVSSFGFSGTNAHLVLEEAPVAASPSTEADGQQPQLLVLSAQSTQALAGLAEKFASYLRSADAMSLAQVAHAVARGRSALPERLALVAKDAAEAVGRLGGFSGGSADGLFRSRATGTNPEVVFLFTGQGAQYVGMGKGLYDSEPVFRAAMDQCAALAGPALAVPLLDVVFGRGEHSALIDDTAYTQPALFAIEFSLAKLWQSWGIEPTAVMGHSVGEYVAATLAGVFSLADGLKLICARGRLMAALPRDGAMVAVFAAEGTVREALSGLEHSVSIGAINGPTNTVISGATSGVDAVLARLQPRGVEFQRLSVSHAFHSPLMQPMLDEFERVAATVAYAPARIGIVSNVTGAQAGAEISTAAYWRRHVREAVRFADSVVSLLQDGYRLFLEVGPAATLTGMAKRCAGSESATWIGSLRKGLDDRQTLLGSAGELFVHGCVLDWRAFYRETPAAAPTSLPTYAFQRKPYWFERIEQPRAARLTPVKSGHPLLGGVVDSPLRVFQSEIGVGSQPWLADHRIFDFTPFPATGFLELAVAALNEIQGRIPVVLQDVQIREGLMLPDDGGTVTVQVVVGGDDANRTVQVFSRAARDDTGEAVADWRLHVSARSVGMAPVPAVAGESLASSAGAAIPVDAYYEKLAKTGAAYGPTFRGIRNATGSRIEVFGDVELPGQQDAASARLIVHPALLDSAMQLMGVMLFVAADAKSESDLYMPVAVEQYVAYRAGARAARCHGKLDPHEPGAESLRGELTLRDSAGEVIARMNGLAFRRVTRAALMRALHGARPALPKSDWLFEVEWRAVPAPQDSPAASQGHWIVLADRSSLAVQLEASLRGQGAGVTVIAHGADAEADLRNLSAALATSSGSLAGVVCLWPLDVTDRFADLAELERAHRELIGRVLKLAQAIAANPAPLWIVTRGAQPAGGVIPSLTQAPLVGLGNVIASELPDLRCTRIDLDARAAAAEARQLFETVWHADREDRIALRNGVRYVARMVPGTLTPPSGEPRVLEISSRGQLDNLRFAPTARRAPARGEVEIAVRATGLNFRDVLNALGMYPGDPGPLGNECAGIVTAVGEAVERLAVGDEVISMVDRSFATYVVAPAAMTVRKPAALSFVEASTIPVTFLTAAYALRTLGRIRPGDRVLVHAATGGVGMAAVQLARLAGAKVFGTAGSPAKRELARALGVEAVADSRSLSFEADLRAATGGEGVDIVLNSLAGDFIPASLRLLRQGGRFIEIGKTGIWNAAEVAREFPGIEYFALYLGEIAAANPDLVRGMLEEMMPQFVDGTLQALPHRVYAVEQALDAFRFMAQGHHVGKIVVTQRQPLQVSGDATYLVTGGLGGLGLACARWAADLGARHLVLMSRRAPTAQAQTQIAELQERGVDVRIAQADVADEASVRRIVAGIGASPHPLRGVLHAAGAVDDALLAEQTWARFEKVLLPKVRGTWNLHEATRPLPLDFFVMFSSGAALMGSPGQGNYAAANSFLDSLAQVRQSNGQPALSINWGSWSEVGMASHVSEAHRRRWESSGLQMIEPTAGVQMMQQAMQGSLAAQVAVLPIVRSKLPADAGPLFADLVASARNAGNAPTEPEVAGIRDKLLGLATEARHGALVAFLSGQVIRMFGLGGAHEIDVRRPLLEMGMDSLMAMELRNRVQTALGVPVAVASLLDGTCNVHNLAGSLAAQLAPDEKEEKWEEGSL